MYMGCVRVMVCVTCLVRQVIVRLCVPLDTDLVVLQCNTRLTSALYSLETCGRQRNVSLCGTVIVPTPLSQAHSVGQ
jgi:hypothetical protein